MKIVARKAGLVFDLFFCLILMPLLVLVGPARFWWSSFPLLMLVASAYFYALYFALRRLRIPALIMRHAYGRIAAIVLATLALTFLLTLYPLPRVEMVIPSVSAYQTEVRNYGFSLSLWFMLMVVAWYAVSVSFVEELYRGLVEKSQLEAERNRAQLNTLRTQVSPHFLFNTLNSIYSLLIGTSPRAEEAIVKFSDMLKYTYQTAGEEFVAVGEEVRYIRNYIDLQLLRLGGKVEVVCREDIDDPGARIPPLLLLTFVENAFKYGAVSTRRCRIEVEITLRDGRLRFSTRNEVVRRRTEFHNELPTGLRNSRHRLELLYPGRHTLTSGETDGNYSLTLQIDL